MKGLLGRFVKRVNANQAALVAYRVNGNKVGKKNTVEAETIASLIIAAIERPNIR